MHCLNCAWVVLLAGCVLFATTPAEAKKSKVISILGSKQQQQAPIESSKLVSAFNDLTKDSWVSRSVSLSEISTNTAIVLGGPQTLRDVYWPVPINIPLRDAAISLDASYLRADEGRTTLLLSLDNAPVAARGIELPAGNASLSVAIPNLPQPTGFVHLGVNWNTVLTSESSGAPCTDTRSTGNLLRIEPTTHLNFRFDAANIRDLSSAWLALPKTPTMLISSNQVSRPSYETAWRVGLTLEHAGKHPKVITFPSVGETVNLNRVFVPEPLRRISAFAALTKGGSYVLKNSAEVGAWFALSQLGDAHADVVVLDKELANALSSSMDALALQVAREAPEAVVSFAQWRTQRLDPIVASGTSGDIRLVLSPGGAALIVSSNSGGKFTSLFDAGWRDTAASDALTINFARLPFTESDEVSLKALMGGGNNLTVPVNGVWSSSFQLDSPQLKGRRPSELVMDLAAAPSSKGYVPVASIFLNDVLLASKRMTADGKRERIFADIPKYALGLNNVVRVSFLRPPESDNCKDNTNSFPVSVLPSSYIVVEGKNSDSDFQGMAARLSQGGEVFVPVPYFAESRQSLARLIRISAATGLSPSKSKLIPIKEREKVLPTESFLALDVGMQPSIPKTLVNDGRLVVNDEKDQKLLEIIGLTSVGIASVEWVNGNTGIVYRSIVDDLERHEKPFRFTDGNFAIVRRGGHITHFESRGNVDRLMIEDVKDPRFKRYIWWVLTGMAIVLFLGLLFAANRYRRNASA